MERVYIETSTVSYLVSRRSRDLIMAARQQITNDWWEQERQNYELFTSELVLEEARAGDQIEAAKRIATIADLPLLDINNEVAVLTKQILSKGILPAKASSDAMHIAIATVHRIDFLLTLNCKHIANAHIRKLLTRFFQNAGYESPVICTPEEIGGIE